MVSKPWEVKREGDQPWAGFETSDGFLVMVVKIGVVGPDTYEESAEKARQIIGELAG